MINNYIKNICLISFALFAPIYLPAGGIQRSLNDLYDVTNSNEIILSTKCSIYCFPELNSKKLRSFKSGTSLAILKYWNSEDNHSWIRVKLKKNVFFDDLSKPSRGWIKI